MQCDMSVATQWSWKKILSFNRYFSAHYYPTIAHRCSSPCLCSWQAWIGMTSCAQTLIFLLSYVWPSPQVSISPSYRFLQHVVITKSSFSVFTARPLSCINDYINDTQLVQWNAYKANQVLWKHWGEQIDFDQEDHESTREEIIFEHSCFQGQDLVKGFMWSNSEKQ